MYFHLQFAQIVESLCFVEGSQALPACPSGKSYTKPKLRMKQLSEMVLTQYKAEDRLSNTAGVLSMSQETRASLDKLTLLLCVAK